MISSIKNLVVNLCLYISEEIVDRFGKTPKVESAFNPAETDSHEPVTLDFD